MPSKSRSPRKPSAEPRERKASATPSSHSNPSKDRNRDTGYPKRDYDQMPPSCKLFVTNIDSKVTLVLSSSVKVKSTRNSEPASSPSAESKTSWSRPKPEAQTHTASSSTTALNRQSRPDKS